MTSFGDLREWGAIHLTRPFYIEVDGVGRHKEEEQWQTGKNRKLSQCHTLQDWRRTVDFGWRLSRVVTCCMSTEKMLTNRAWFDQSLVPGSPNRLDSVRDKWWRKAKWKKKKRLFFFSVPTLRIQTNKALTPASSLASDMGFRIK